MMAERDEPTAKEWRKGYEKQRKHLQKMHRALLDIWRYATPGDTSERTYWDDPQAVFDSVLKNLRHVEAADDSETDMGDQSLVMVTIKTRHPEDFLLHNRRDGTRWVIRDGSWFTAPPEADDEGPWVLDIDRDGGYRVDLRKPEGYYRSRERAQAEADRLNAEILNNYNAWMRDVYQQELRAWKKVKVLVEAGLCGKKKLGEKPIKPAPRTTRPRYSDWYTVEPVEFVDD